MKDLKHIHFYENLLEQTGNDLVLQEKEAGGVAVGYTCYYIPEVLLNCGKAFSVRLRAPDTGSLVWRRHGAHLRFARHQPVLYVELYLRLYARSF